MDFFGSYWLVFLGSLVSGGATLTLAGVAVHHGLADLPGLVVAGTLATFCRSWFVRRWRASGPKRRLPRQGWRLAAARGCNKVSSGVLRLRRAIPIPKGPFQVRSLRIVGQVLFFLALGYVLGHFAATSALIVRVLVGLLTSLWLAIVALNVLGRLPPQLSRTSRPARWSQALGNGVLCALVISPWLKPAEVSTEDLLGQGFGDAGPVPVVQTFQWIDQRYGGVRTALTTARGLLLAKGRDGSSDIYLVRVRLNHEGLPAQVVAKYNLTDTAAVSESGMQVHGKWAAWQIEHAGKAHSIELADLRSEGPGRGPGWSHTTRIQRGITNWQETGQWRGLSRTTVKLVEPSQGVAFKLGRDTLAVELPAGEFVLDLGRRAARGVAAAGAEVTATETPRPGDLTTWAVDRLRAVSWIGSERMQWIKGVAFRAADKLETLEHEFVGIDADEAIAEQLGDVIDRLPLATNGTVPNWPPEPLEPLLSSPLAGEGKWVNIGNEELFAGTLQNANSPFVFTFVRTDKKRPYHQVSITLWDPRRLELNIVAGTVEPKSMTGEIGTGLIPRDPEVLPRVVAAFNGAFQAVHGHFGMTERGRVILPPKPFGATVAVLDDGSAGFGTWPAQAPIPPNVRSLRQNMTPLVVDGKVNPYRRHWWGGVPEGWTEEARTVRSGLCLTREGFIAYFYSPSIDPDHLAAAMLRARCSYAIHLDMNAGHCGFEFYRVAAKGKLPTVERSLDPAWEARGDVSGVRGFEFQSRLMVRKMPLMDFPRYIQPSSRDFFYLTRRVLLPPPALRPIFPDEPGDGKWRAEGMPGNAWPHALAFSRLHVAAATKGRQPLLLTAVDAKQVKVTQAPEQAVLGLALPAGDLQELGVRLTADGFQLSSDIGGDLAQLTGAGAPPDYQIRSAICVSKGGSLLTIFTAAAVAAPSLEAWRLALERVQCAQLALFEHSVEVILPNSGSEATAATALRGDVLWLARSPLLGAHRIFESTPIVSPKNWAFIQKKSVAYAAPPTKD